MEHLTPVDRVFVKRTRRGQVKTHVRQHYLRDDLPTGAPQIDDPELEPRLSSSAVQYLVIDTNVALHQIDLLERPALRDVIVLQTVLEEVKHNKITVHKRLRAIISDEKRRFHVFSNDFHRETYAERKPGETPNDRNDRAIRMATKWYQAQLGDSVEVVLLTNDAENLRLAREDGLSAQRVHEYVRGRPDAAELVAITGLSSAEAEVLLEASGGNLEQAVQLHFESEDQTQASARDAAVPPRRVARAEGSAPLAAADQ